MAMLLLKWRIGLKMQILKYLLPDKPRVGDFKGIFSRRPVHQLPDNLLRSGSTLDSSTGGSLGSWGGVGGSLWGV